jgi:hypothetical protein
MASVDNFKPGSGGTQVSVVGNQAKLGQNFALGSVPPPPTLTQTPVPSHQQSQIGQGKGPKGAQPVSLMGMPAQGNPVLGQAPQMPMMQASMPMSGLSMQQQQPVHQLGKGPSMDGGEVHTIMVEGMGSDGKKYIAEFDAVFPRGTKVMGVTEKVRE